MAEAFHIIGWKYIFRPAAQFAGFFLWLLRLSSRLKTFTQRQSCKGAPTFAFGAFGCILGAESARKGGGFIGLGDEFGGGIPGIKS